MKHLYVEMARKNGQLARLKAARVAVMLRMYNEKPSERQWLRVQAIVLSKRVSYHLRQAWILSQHIKRLESELVSSGRTYRKNKTAINETRLLTESRG